MKIRQWVYAHPMRDSVLEPPLFELRELPVPALEAGQALVRVKLINVHAATRQRLASGATPLGGTVRSNYACAEVIRSRDPAFREGEVIACQAGWQDLQVISSSEPAVGYAVPSEAVKALNRTQSQWCYAFRPELAGKWPAAVLMDVFGTSGMTAYFGMRECGPLRPGEQVAVAVTGSVGSLVAQLARHAGCRVVGIAGGPEACAWARDTLRVDACVDYRAADFEQRLAAALPQGIDVGSDGVGGRMTECLVGQLKPQGRLFSYGSAASFYREVLDTTPRPGRPLREAFGLTAALEEVVRTRGIDVQAWIVDKFYDQRLEAEDELSRLLSEGAIQPVHRVVDGFEQLPAAISSLYRTPRFGKLQIRFVVD